VLEIQPDLVQAMVAMVDWYQVEERQEVPMDLYCTPRISVAVVVEAKGGKVVDLWNLKLGDHLLSMVCCINQRYFELSYNSEVHI
jgi:hypothetical protein